MFGTVGGPELFLILVMALIVFGPRKLPEIGKSIGKMLVEFRRASNDFKRTIEDEVEADKLRSSLETRQLDPAPPPAEPPGAPAAPLADTAPAARLDATPEVAPTAPPGPDLPATK